MLSHIFVTELKNRGITSLYIGREIPDLQYLAVKMLVKGYGIVEERREGEVVKEVEGVKLLKRVGSEKSDCVFKKGGKNVITNPPEYPKIVIDMGLFNELTEDEKRKTLLQVNMTLGTIRRFWWDGNLVIVGDLKVGKAVNVQSFKTDAKAIVLDPQGEIDADEKLIRDTDVFIIGGIVDKGRRLKDATRRLAEMRGYDYPRVRIKLRDTIVGVPDEINKIAEIVLRVKEGESLEDAIISTMSKSDKVSRLLYDTHRFGLQVLEEEARWLKVDESVINVVKSRLKASKTY